MIRLKVYPYELFGMVAYLQVVRELYGHRPLTQQSILELVLQQYAQYWTPGRLTAWNNKLSSRVYPLNLPLAVARALHVGLRMASLAPFQQLFLDKLDQAIANYQHPLQSIYNLETTTVTGWVADLSTNAQNDEQTR